MKVKQRVPALILVIAVLLTFSSCDNDKDNKSDIPTNSDSISTTAPYKRQPMKTVAYDQSAFIMEGDFGAYTERTSDGYVCAVGKSNKRLKFKVILNEQEYVYDLKSDGTVEVFPLQLGNGTYNLEIWENIVDTRYSQTFATEISVTLNSELAPYLIPTQIVNYHEDSQVVLLANELTKNSSTESEVVETIYKYIVNNITYDTQLAQKIQAKDVTTYVPDLDSIISKKAGICYDYSSLFAAMLRSQGIPTKLVTGNVAPNDIYHAWNMVYLKDSGWTYKKINIDKNQWGRIDTTFGAGDNSSQLGNFVGDGKNYIDKNTY